MKGAKMTHECIIKDLDSEVKAEIFLFNDGTIEISLADKCSDITYYCYVNDFDRALKKARAKLDI